MPKCRNCGYVFKTHSRDCRKSVKKCAQCTKIFSDKLVDDIIKDWFRKV